MAFSGFGTVHRPTVTGKCGMVASAHPLASLAGLRILMEGGNAIDAAVATAAALNVVEPYMSGLGGDGYMHIYSANKKEHQVLDYMGRAPGRAEIGLFDNPEKRELGPLSCLVPGACGGWLEALARYGTMDTEAVFGPAIEYAEDGFAVTVKNHEFIGGAVPNLLRFPASAENYLTGGTGPRPGEVLVQKDLAQTFRAIAEGGSEVFYKSEIAERIVKYVEEHGGIMTMDDLSGFSPEWQDPIYTTYRGHQVFAPPPPCQAVQYLEMLNILEGFDLEEMGHNTVDTLHLFIEAAKLATADRVAYAGIENPPTAGLISKAFAEDRRGLIGDRATYSGGEVYSSSPDALSSGDPHAWMATECTTHFDTVDSEGNAVSTTQSLGGAFGSAAVVPGTGLALNNFLKWFDYDPDSPNVIGPRKKMEMCMSPVQVWDDERLRLLIGTPGSYGILQTTLQMIMNVMDHGMHVQAAIEAPRLKTSLGYRVDVETRISEEVLGELEQKGHEFNRLGDWSAGVGGGQGIEVDRETGSFMGGADPRRDGYALGF